jgi:tyrosine-protein phosphatase SIW14
MLTHKTWLIAALLSLCAAPSIVVAQDGSAWSQAQQDIPNLHAVKKNLARGGHPGAAGLQDLKALGVSTILNLETEAKPVEREAAYASDLGLRHISRPMDWLTEPSDAFIDELLNILDDPTEEPLFIHCKHGKDRTGLVIGLFRVERQGWAPKKAYAEMLSYGFSPQLKALDGYFRKRTGM